MIVIMGTATDDRADSPAVGLGIRLTVAALILATATIGGAALNPARSLGPGTFSDPWLYIAGPVLGALLAAFVYDLALRPGTPPSPRGALEERPAEDAGIPAAAGRASERPGV